MMYRVVMNVIHQPEQVRFLLYRNTFWMFLKKTSTSPFLLIDCLGIGNCKSPHLFPDFLIILFNNPYQKMKMGWYKAVCPYLYQRAKIFIPFVQEKTIISFLKKELIRLTVCPIEDMIKFMGDKRNLSIHCPISTGITSLQ